MKDNNGFPTPTGDLEPSLPKISNQELAEKRSALAARELENHALVDLIAERTSDLIAITTFSLIPKYIYLSPSHKKILGYDPADLLNRSALDFVHPDDLRTLLPLLEKYVVALNSLVSNSASDLKVPTERMLYRFRDKSGNWHFLETTGDLLDDDCILFVSRDVTKRMKAEEELLKSKMLLESQVLERTEELAKANVALRHEMSERVKKEESLKESETRYRTILENIEDGYFEVDLAGNLTFFNSALCRMTGYSPAELLGMNNRNYTEPAMAKRMFEIFNRIYRTGEPSKITDYEVIRKDGTKCMVELSTSLMRDFDGGPEGFRGIARDVTERERIKQELRESEEKYRTILQSIEDGYYEDDIRGNFCFFNESMARILGYSPEELMGMNNRQIMTEEMAKEVYRMANEVYRTGISAKALDWEVIRKDHEKRHLETSISVVRDSQGKPIGFRGIARDRTERWLARKAIEESEKKYRTILQSIEEGYYEVDISGNMVFFNDSMCRILGYFPEELKGMNNRRFMSEETAKKVYQTFNQVYTTGQPTKALGWELVRKDGQRQYVETSVSLIWNEKAEPVGFRGIARDITEQKSLEKARERIINHLSHELGTPLAIIESTLAKIPDEIKRKNFERVLDGSKRGLRNVSRLKDLKDKIDDILNGKPISERQQVLNIIEGALTLLEQLKNEPLKEGAETLRQGILKQLESLYRIEEPVKEKIILDSFLNEVLQETASSLKGRNLEIVKDFQQEIFLQMDRKILKKACESFLRNAIENTPDGGRIEITTKCENALVRIDFRDSGVGILPEDQKMIFGGFFHTQDTHLYASRKPYEFNAGGSGVDLLRTKIFSERLGFFVDFKSTRCEYLPTDKDECPGRVSSCPFIKTELRCLASGSTFSLIFPQRIFFILGAASTVNSSEWVKS